MLVLMELTDLFVVLIFGRIRFYMTLRRGNEMVRVGNRIPTGRELLFWYKNASSQRTFFLLKERTRQGRRVLMLKKYLFTVNDCHSIELDKSNPLVQSASPWGIICTSLCLCTGGLGGVLESWEKCAGLPHLLKVFPKMHGFEINHTKSSHMVIGS